MMKGQPSLLDRVRKELPDNVKEKLNDDDCRQAAQLVAIHAINYERRRIVNLLLTEKVPNAAEVERLIYRLF